MLIRTPHAIAFLDAHPIAPGHALVVPVSHAPLLQDLDIQEIAPLFQVVQTVTGAVQHAVNAPAATIGINNGTEAGQAIHHLHIHIMPRFSDDGGVSIHTVVHNPPQESQEVIVEKIKKFITTST
jgi:histidine triad (HIT) family protein